MKALALVLALLILLTGFDLCKDGHIDGKAKTEQVSQSNHQNEGASDTCNPFCHCSRCPFSVLLPGEQLTKPVYLTLILDRVSPTSRKLMRPASPIWQPPKIFQLWNDLS